MALLVPLCGEIALLDKILKTAVDEDFILKLYKVDIVISAATVAGDFTVCDFDGYPVLHKPLTRANWISASDGTGLATSSYNAEQSWTCVTGSQTVYGYYVIGATSLTLLWAEKFTVSRTLADGDQLRMTPKFTLRYAY